MEENDDDGSVTTCTDQWSAYDDAMTRFSSTSQQTPHFHVT